MPDRLRVWLLALDRYEMKLRVSAGRARNSAIIHAAQAYQYSGSLPNYIAEGHRRRLKNVLTEHYGKVIPHFAAQALAGIRSHRVGHAAATMVAEAARSWQTKSPFEIDFFQLREVKNRTQVKAVGFEHRMQEWIGREALRKATLIASTDLDDIRGAIAEGVTGGLGTAEIASSIRKVSQLTPFRAATVARTETHAAATFGSIETVRDAERDLGVVMDKEWLATRDSRTRPEHLAADGQRVELNEKFTVGGEVMDRPGDPSASPANLINCRCSISFEESTT
ncbi:MAG TPA: phage minor head protein [Urbifossiella sp.]|nr:phage minor head protein [Urbifossiella sp.]